MIGAENSSGNIDSIRGDARISIAKKWADRRKLQEENQQRRSGESTVEVIENNTLRSLSSSSEQGNFSIPPLCVLLRRSWNQTINSLIQHQSINTKNNSSNNKNNNDKKVLGSRRSSVETKQENSNKRISFPSVLSVLKANAVKLQVETIMENELTGAGSPLNVLPANCNDFTTSAVNHMSDSRSRAFLLLDFSAIVQTHTVWRKRLGIPNMHRKDVQIVYSARHNCNARLLQLLQRLGVGLRVATKYDLAAVREAMASNHERKNAVVWDDTSVLVKPNSFYRNLLLSHNNNDDKDDDFTAAATTTRAIPITVGNADEMKRIHTQMHNICMRRRERHGTFPKLDFVLKLDTTTDDFKNWKTVLRRMHETALECPNTSVVGLALDLGGNGKTSASGTRDSGSGFSEKNSDILFLDAMSDLIENWMDQMSTSKIRTSTETVKRPQIHLTNPITATEIESGVIEWIQRHRKFCNGITIDASRVLMVNAAALCTRIIGVKSNKSDSGKHGENGIKQNESHAIQQHLYIDDGCYGSLSNYPNEGIPLPLKSKRLVRSLSATTKQLAEEEKQALVNTTVWGPTCDGLDKVCSNVALPRLCRDDWLVFADLGFCNEGTCFNGFSPPDIACCVLGGNQ